MDDATEIFSASLFVDSGAHSLYNEEVLKHGERKGKHGRDLAKPPVIWGKGDRPGIGRQDFSYFSLKEGTPFRAYCDSYARFMRTFRRKAKKKGLPILFANVDAISNPELSWEIQKFFEEEHGVQPVPIVHYGTPLVWVDRYLESGKYKLLGVGGLGQGVSRHDYIHWGDKFFSHICPASNQFLPLIRTHGFAMTSWELMCRWPWWSVDSATWVKLSAYGWLYVPRKSEKKEFCFDRPPMTINFSARSPQKSKTEKHFLNCKESVQAHCLRWLEYLELEMGSVDAEGKMEVFGVSSHHRARSIANLSYLKELEASSPKYPCPLDIELVRQRKVAYQRGFGI